MFSASHHIFLTNKLVEDISMFNVGGIFENWDALDTQNNFRKRATGVFASIWNKAKLNKTRATKIKTPIELIDTVTYYNSNNIPREVAYPKFFGWRFENDSTQTATVILTNISADTLIVSVENLLISDVSWEHWHSDSLFDLIDSVNYINLSIDTGRSDIVLLPYSINVAQGNLCNQSTSQSSVSLCNGDSVLIGSNIYTTGGFYTDTLNIDGGCDSIIYTNIIVNFNTFSYDTLSVNNSITWNKIYIDKSGDYSAVLTNSLGCDSIINLQLTISDKTMITNPNNRRSKIIKTIDLLGQEMPIRTNTPMFYIYDDGSVEKKIIIE